MTWYKPMTWPIRARLLALAIAVGLVVIASPPAASLLDERCTHDRYPSARRVERILAAALVPVRPAGLPAHAEHDLAASVPGLEQPVRLSCFCQRQHMGDAGGQPVIGQQARQGPRGLTGRRP